MDLQKPEMFRAAIVRYKSKFDKIIEDKEGKEDKFKSTPKITGTKFFVNGELVEDLIYVPTPKDLFTLNLVERDALDDIIFDESPPFTISNSTFKAFCSPATSYREVRDAYKKLKLDNRYATHIIMACAFNSDSGHSSFSCDDGEYGTGNELEKLMKEENFNGYALFVIRWKLDGNMDPRRFKCILSVASKVIKKVKTKEEMRPKLLHSDVV